METGAELLAHDIRDLGDNGGVLRNPDRVERIAEQIAALRTHASEEQGAVADTAFACAALGGPRWAAGPAAADLGLAPGLSALLVLP